MVLFTVAARLARRHSRAAFTIERVLEFERCDPNLARLECVEQPLSVVGSIIRTDARVIAAHDEMRAAEVLANECVEDGFSGTGVTHRGLQRAEDDALRRIIIFEQHAITAQTHLRRYVVRLRLTDERMK